MTVAALVGYDDLAVDLPPMAIDRQRGDIAQLGERGVRNAEVAGSSPAISTTAIGMPL